MNHAKLGLCALGLLALVVACGGAPTPVTVTGKAVGLLGAPIGTDWQIKIGNRPSTALNTNGSFSVAGLAPATPYDAVVFNPSIKKAYVFKGLTRSDPTLGLPELPTSGNEATVSGNLSGGAGFPNPINHKTLVFYGGETQPVLGQATPAGPAYGPANFGWFDSEEAVTGKLYALQLQTTAGFPSSYTGFGSFSRTLTKDGTFPATNIALTDVPEDSFTGKVSIPAGSTLTHKTVILKLATNAGTVLVNDPSATTAFSYVMPRITGATVTLFAGAEQGTGARAIAWKTGLVTGASTLLTVPSPANFILPDDAATGVGLSTDFQTSGLPGGVNVFDFDGPAGQPDIVVITTANTMKIPDLSSIGLGFPASGTVGYSWNISSHAPFTSVDTAASTYSSGGYRSLFLATTGGPSPNIDGSFSYTPSRSFVTP